MASCLPSLAASTRIPRSWRYSPSCFSPRAYTREVYFNHDFSTTKKLQAGVDLVTDLLGVTLGPKGRNVVLENKYGPPRIVNDGETILKEVELQDPVKNVGVKLVRQAAAKTNDVAGDGSTTAIVLARGLIDEGVKVIVGGMNPIQIVRGIEKTAMALVSELRLMSREIKDNEIADVAAVSAGNDYTTGNLVANALKAVGKNGFIRIETGRGTENSLEVVEGMQFERGYLSPYFVTDRASMSTEFCDCKILLIDKIIANPKELLRILDEAMKGGYPLLVIAEGIEEDALALIIRNKLKGLLKVAATKAPAFGERKSDYLDDIAILTGGTVIRDDEGITLEKAGIEVLGSAVKVVITKDSTLLVTDGSTQAAVEKRVAELKCLVENTEEKFDKKVVNERIARLSDGIAIIQVGAQTVVELKDKMLRVEDALNATRAAIEEGVVVGGGCCLLRLSKKVDCIKEFLDNDEQKVGADIFKQALSYPTMLIARNAGMNGNVVVEKVLSSNDVKFGYNGAKNCYEDLMAAGILDPSKVVRCCLEHAASVAKALLTADIVVVDAMENMPVLVRTPMRTSNLIPASRGTGF